ncbi:hypothetical protein ACFR99_06620 [Haloarchaeobius amylolyticus]|uniref:DUF1102 domain-containing protein n=1 Tax=Haloarchaeobius amylolyticus TaxID=1198296 RepID=A0ABD6BF62_9EURY
MSMTKRNVLFVLGLVVAIGGMAIASGAFTQVEADRTVDVTVDDDGNAFLQIEDAGSDFVTTSDGEIEISTANFDGGVHQNATVTTDSALNLTHNGNDDMNYTVHFDTTGVTGGDLVVRDEDGNNLSASDTNLTVDSDDATADNQVYFEIETKDSETDLSGNLMIEINEEEDTT